MKKLPVKTPLTLVFGFAVAVILFASSQPVLGQSCKGITDDEVVASIYAKIDKDKNLIDQKSHFNVAFSSNTVVLVGWTDDVKSYNAVLYYVNLTAYEVPKGCISKINVNDFWETEAEAPSSLRSATGCGQGTIQCGDICIPENEKCQFKSAMQSNEEED